MLKFTAKDKEQLAEIKQGWLSLLILAILAFSQIFVEDWFGRGWRVIAAILAVPIWLVIRPWHFGLLPGEARRRMRNQGIKIFCVLVLFAAISYFRK